MVCDAGEKETVGEGLMVTSTLNEVPAQRNVVDGVTTYVAKTGLLVVLVNVWTMLITGLFCADPPTKPDPIGVVQV